jgi:hypothetical protein
MTITGSARRTHLAHVRGDAREGVRKMMMKACRSLSIAEAEHMLLLALEDYAGMSAEEIRERGARVAYEHCREQTAPEPATSGENISLPYTREFGY